MNNDLLLILQSCDTLKDINEEFHKPFGWLKIKEKRECKKLKNRLLEKINSFKDDKWTIEYLYELEYTLLAYYNKLEPYMNNVYFENYDPSKELNPKIFVPIYFSDSINTIIMLDIVSDNINFTVFDSKTGNSFTVSSSLEVQKSQKKIETVCKQKIIDMLTEYLNNYTKYIKNSPGDYPD